MYTLLYLYLSYSNYGMLTCSDPFVLYNESSHTYLSFAS